MFKVRNSRTAAGLASVVLVTGALVGCSAGTGATDAGGSGSATAVDTAVDAASSAADVLAANKADHAGDADADATVDESQVVDIELTGESVTITDGGTYRLQGTLDDGQVTVDAPDATVRLVLDGVRITSSTGAAIAATDADHLVVVVADGSENTLSDTDSYAEQADVNAALFSSADLTVTGGGTLTVHGNGNDGIASKDGLVIDTATVIVEAVDDGVRGKDYVVVDSGTVTVDSGGDGIKADNDQDADSGYVWVDGGTVTVDSGGDGIDAATDLVVTGGLLDVTAGGGSGVAPDADVSTKGLKSAVISVLEAGTITVDAADDAVHGNGALHLAGARLTLASGDDAVHADTTLLVDDGSLDITASVEGLEAAHITVAGGDIQLVASDDGVNAAGGTTTDGSDATAGGRPGGGPGRGGPGGGEAVGDYSLAVTGGTLVIDAGGDGFDSNGTAEITGGTVVVNGPTMTMNGALDVNGGFQISGGVLIAAGSAGMVVTPDAASAQGWLSATVDAAVPAGTTLHVVDSTGAVLVTFVTSKTVQNLVYSSADVVTGEQYQVYAGGSATGTDVGGLAESGELGSAVTVATVTAGTGPAGFGGGPDGAGRPAPDGGGDGRDGSR
ncbi:carbohydrate-binding domain-containing protein [Solwaraspora sp. WMMB335]|uniref:carbohydrate-binding domain-containing protein n=1 Tax=Solwaraspora sp. WMMB335 TaxID=3404118 RepID=UPI003B95B49D